MKQTFQKEKLKGAEQRNKQQVGVRVTDSNAGGKAREGMGRRKGNLREEVLDWIHKEEAGRGGKGSAYE